MTQRLAITRIVAYGVCPLLLAVGGVGLWRLFAWVSLQEQLDRFELVSNLAWAVAPLALFALIAAFCGVALGSMRATGDYQARIDGLQQRLRYHEDLVRLVADSRPGATAIIDVEGRYWFVNTVSAARHGMNPKEMVGRNIDKVLGQQESQKLRARLQQVRDSKMPLDTIDRIKGQGSEHYVRSSIISLPDVTGLSGAVLVNEDDVTSLMVEREARERMFRQVIDTLVAVVDRRDPYAAGHSARVGQIARAIAEEMRLPTEQIETAEIAGLLMNFGKVLVPRDILTKTAALSGDELKQVRDSILTSADILALIGFSQPVVPTLRQVLERYDGTGVPEGRQGENILLTARIVMVANAFVALVSPRAHRPGIGPQGALESMHGEAGSAFDPGIVDALRAYIKNSKHKLEWLAVA